MVRETISPLLYEEYSRKNTEIKRKLHNLPFFELPADVNAKISLFLEYFQRPSASTKLLQTFQYVWGEPPITHLGKNIEIRDVDTKKLHYKAPELCSNAVPDTISTDLIPFAVATVFRKSHTQHSDINLTSIPGLDEKAVTTLSQSLAMNDNEQIPEYLDRIRKSIQTPDNNQRLVLNLIEVAGYIDNLLIHHPKMQGRKIFAMELMGLAFDALADFERYKTADNLIIFTANDLDMVLYPQRNHPPDSFITILQKRWQGMISALPREARRKRLKILETLGVNPVNLTLVDNFNVLKENTTGIFSFPHKDGYKNPNATYNWGEMALLHFILDNSMSKSEQTGTPGELNMGLFTLTDSNILMQSLPSFIPPDMKKKMFDMLMKFSSDFFGVGIIDIDRKKPITGTKRIIQALKDNKSVIIAPEGDGWLTEMILAMPGIGFWAKASGKPIIPVTFREVKLQHGNYNYEVIIHPPLFVPKDASDEFKNAVHHAAAMISASSLEPSERGIYGNEKVMRRLHVFEVLADYPQTKRVELEKKLGFSFS